MTAAATAATSQQLWTSGEALVQRAQEPNIPFRESLTSMSRSGVSAIWACFKFSQILGPQDATSHTGAFQNPKGGLQDIEAVAAAADH